MSKFFIVERKNFFENNHKNIFLHFLYSPIIGNNAIVIYHLLLDFYFINKNNASPITSFELLKRISKVNNDELEISLKKLEAVGLIRKFLRSDEEVTLFVINEPLSIQEIKKNSFLFKNITKVVDELFLEKIESVFTDKKIDKSSFYEITTKFQDLFPNEEKLDISSTLELPVKPFVLKKDAINNLNPFQFVYWLSKEKPKHSQINSIQNFQQLGFLNSSINVVIDYVFEKNNKFVIAHFESILKDLFSKNIKSFEEISLEIKNAFNSKNNKNFSSNLELNSFEQETDTNDVDFSWEEIFKSLGGEI